MHRNQYAYYVVQFLFWIYNRLHLHIVSDCHESSLPLYCFRCALCVMENSIRDVEPDTEHTRTHTQFNCLHLSACILHTSATEIESHVLNFKRDAKCHSNRDEEEEVEGKKRL